jgi:uncharacterized protein YqcC (DUF446 family)
LNEPPADAQRAYTEDVMRRIRSAPASSLVWRWLPRPQVALAFGTALACVLAVVVVGNRAPGRMAHQVEREAQLLAELGELETLSTDDLDDEMQTVERLMLAQAGSEVDEEAWIDQTVELLGGVEEELDADLDDEAVEEWLEELQSLDDEELAAS